MSILIRSESHYFVRRMKEEDLASVRAIEALSFSSPWSDNTFVSFPLVVVRRPDDEVVAYIIFWQIREDVQVNNIAVRPDCRGQGIAEALMRYVIDKVRKAGATFMTLEVRPSNTAATNIYKKLGFEVLGTRKNYYTKPDEDALILGLVLDQ
jgi:ribosomal-protein-alanine N-acetyltransferase